jgi:hypothetical protein
MSKNFLLLDELLLDELLLPGTCTGFKRCGEKSGFRLSSKKPRRNAELKTSRLQA